IIRPRDPGRCATAFPRIGGPCIAYGLALTGDGVEAPDSFSGVRVVSINETTRAKLRARNAGHDEIFDNQWSCCRAIALLVVRYRGFPKGRTRFCVQSNKCPLDIDAE